MTIDQVYECFVNSEDYNREDSKRDNMNLSWLLPYIDEEQYLLLEQEISRYAFENDRKMFHHGFTSACELLNNKVNVEK